MTCSVERTLWLPIKIPAIKTAKKPLPPSRLVAANTAKPADNIKMAYMPSAKCILGNNRERKYPKNKPIPKPKLSCCNSSPKKPSAVCPAGSTFKAINPVTNKIANGSLAPDSSSSVAWTRSFNLTPPLRSSENTAAASVEPTIAASNSPKRQSTSSSHVTNTPSIITVASTPQVASVIAGFSPTRNDLKEVRSPPSSKIQANAACPTKLAIAY